MKIPAVNIKDAQKRRLDNLKRMFNRFLMMAVCTVALAVPVLGAQTLVPGGDVIGLALRGDSVTVAAFDEKQSCGREAGLRVGDEILTIDGHAIDSAGDVRYALDRGDRTVELVVRRGGKETAISLSPTVTTEGPRLGVYLRQGVTGIGTVTFYDPATGCFGTLGHGVNDGDGGLLTMTEGSALPAQVVSVDRGRSGAPGQLQGQVCREDELGTLARNTPQGVFGKFHSTQEGEAIPVAEAGEVHTGAATIRSTVDDGGIREYSVQILKVYAADRPDGRNLLLQITDPTLLTQTGGIVQGMSGSPIIQDGKLVGAVTHVLVNDPTRGYGIFIENMLDAAS